MALRLDRLERLRAELEVRNEDNLTRTESYLELYALTRAEPPEWPWLLLAHLVSRNAGYLMGAVHGAMTDRRRIFDRAALTELFLFLERANYLIFYDAWHHVLTHLSGRPLTAGRAARFVHDAYRRHRAAPAGPETERRLVFDLIENEQNYIERRVVHRAGFERARAMVAFFEAVGADRALRFGPLDSEIRVGRFAELARRIATGQSLFDRMLGDRSRREELFAWALAHPHTGSREDYGGGSGIALRDAWPAAEVRRLARDIHAPPEPDPLWP